MFKPENRLAGMNSMNDSYFIDTNIFVYSFDPRAPEKQSIAQEIILNALTDGHGVISSQVVQEFLNVATRKFACPLSSEDGLEYLQTVLKPLCKVFASIELYEKTLDITSRYNYSFYDSLLIAAALRADCALLYSEDLQHGQKIEGLTLINPFIEKCDRLG
jgi:predicted nucleic acid-binding protein